jgi:hypothetical protein
MTTSPTFVLTNWMNLNGMLSSRIIGPRPSFRKYYQDLLELTDGYVSLLRGSVSSELVDYVSAKAPTGPALLELAHPPSATIPRAVELTGALPFSDVTAIHLPTERSLREHLARRYKNVHPHEELLRVTPKLFTDGVTLTDVRQASPPSGSIPDTLKPTDWQRTDRIRGAMAAAVFAATAAHSLETAAGLLPNGPNTATPGSRLELGWLVGSVQRTALAQKRW